MSIQDNLRVLCTERANIVDEETTIDPRLNVIVERIEAQLAANFPDYEIKGSVGKGSLAKVWHICILPENQSVSAGIYTGILFDKNGNGIVIGSLKSVTNDPCPEVNTVVIPSDVADLDGASKNTKYQNAFFAYSHFTVENIPDDSYLLEQIRDYVEFTDEILLDKTLLDGILGIDQNERRVYSSIAKEIRSKQYNFRKRLIDLYKGCCPITENRNLRVLEAAHIIPHSEKVNYSDSNGILLRVDIHKLFDASLLKIVLENDDYIVKLHDSLLNDNDYVKFNNKKIKLPDIVKPSFKDRSN